MRGMPCFGGLKLRTLELSWGRTAKGVLFRRAGAARRGMLQVTWT